MKFKKIGMRTFKTGLSVAITLFVCDAVNITNPFFAAIAAIIAMESTIEATFVTARDRMFGTVLGAALAFVVSLVLPLNALTLGLGVLIVIYICNLFNWQGTIKIATIVFMAVLLSNEQSTRLSYAVLRIIDTFIGLSIGTLVNYYIFPNKRTSSAALAINSVAVKVEAFESTIRKHLSNAQVSFKDLFEELRTYKLFFEVATVDPQYVKVFQSAPVLFEKTKAIQKLMMHLVFLADVDQLEHSEENLTGITAYHTHQAMQIVNNLVNLDVFDTLTHDVIGLY